MTALLLTSLFGVSIEVYLILLVIAFPVFFFWRWLFKRMLKTDEKTRKIVSWSVTLLTTPLVYAGLVIIMVMSLSYYPSRDFDRERWFADEEKRYELSEDIIESEMLIGKTKAEVRQILGTGAESNTDDNDNWWYYLGFKPGMFNIDPDVLDIYFENGKVSKVSQHET